MKTIRIVCGERDWKDKETIYSVLDEELSEHGVNWLMAHPMPDEQYTQLTAQSKLDRLKQMHEDFILRHGICEGADWIANDWGLERGVTIERFRADWRPPSGYNPAAGPIRNREMAQAEPQAQACLAFWSGKMRIKHGKPEYSGTLDMIKTALGCGIPVRIYPPRKDTP